ncbi:MAG TPA: hypothetical protein PK175_03130 [Syntrophales bacterium]|jgi:hypothetical protein|nr:hypothetical protein [Syntrophales bacterium]HPC32456.1 hypothetical protein [Syntrophales bacterium]HQG33849.1 hypothetical protein [Syntrophales bacterium]HQI35147.1 hypothetical protein [Syntrophales bacterium]HQJ30806.1 hypothetical protein [Syntrophales bacterium]
MKIRYICFGALLVFTLAGCAYVQGYLDMAKERGISEEYNRSLRAWTREMTAHSQLETRFHISATYRSPAFNAALLKEQARVRQWPEARVKEQGEVWLQNMTPYREFLVYVYTSDREANDFDRRGSIWSVFLKDGRGKQTEPVEIRGVERITAEMEAFFPFINKYYGRCYLMKFPAGEEQAELQLVFASVLGRVALQWEAAGPSPVAPRR